MATLHANLKSLKKETTTEKQTLIFRARMENSTSNSYLNNGSKLHVLPGILLSNLTAASHVFLMQIVTWFYREHFKSTIFLYSLSKCFPYMLLPQNCIKYDMDWVNIKALNLSFFHNHCKKKLTVIQGIVISIHLIFLYISLSKRTKPWAHYKLVFYKHESNTYTELSSKQFDNQSTNGHLSLEPLFAQSSE